MAHNEKKTAALGMPWGTANNRLRKMILFHLLSKHQENVCYKCDNVIDNIEDLSIEHKNPWEGNSVELFWDMENIAFSHMFCNKPHRVYHRPSVPVAEGSAWCYRCKSEKDGNEFHKNISNLSGYNAECKLCKSLLNSQRVR
jgi:hypothetical protein